jgi:hypothetical protein
MKSGARAVLHCAGPSTPLTHVTVTFEKHASDLVVASTNVSFVG